MGTIRDLLNYDALVDAEERTGKSYKEDEETVALGMLLQMNHSERKEEALKAIGDTTILNKLDRYLSILDELGFEQVLRLDFEDTAWGGRSESFFVFWNELGILLDFDTFEGSVNGGKFFYNLEPYDQENIRHDRCLSSGGYRQFDGKWVWVGDHDCREAIKYHLSELNEFGRFLNPWLERPFIWFVHHGDKAHVDVMKESGRITEERIAMLPEHVRRAITPE